MKMFSLLIMMTSMLMLTGCVDRSLEFDSKPRSALVMLDGVKLGYTPLTLPFSHYGTRKIQFEKKGYVKKVVIKEIEKPWYQYYIIEFFADVIWPLWPQSTTDSRSLARSW